MRQAVYVWAGPITGDLLHTDATLRFEGRADLPVGRDAAGGHEVDGDCIDDRL